MRVIGVDPGSRACGYGVVESSGNDLKYIESGTIIPPPDNSLPKRLDHIYNGILDIIERFSPTCMSIEEIFFAKNAKSAIKLGQARGVAILAAANKELSVNEYAPTKIKLAITGKGRANKSEVQKMLNLLLGVDEFKSTDESDAVAIAICHINFSRFESISGISPKTNKRRNKRFTLNDISS